MASVKSGLGFPSPFNSSTQHTSFSFEKDIKMEFSDIFIGPLLPASSQITEDAYGNKVSLTKE